MSDLKIGDLVKVYGPDYGYDPADWDGEIGVVNAIRDEKEIDIYINEYLCTYHRKQCRKLVTLKKCNVCDDGKDRNLKGACDSDWCDRYGVCPECNGKGKVKA